jgi:hypothetical protein
MMGAIGHATLKAGGQPGFDSLIEEWTREVRTQIGDIAGYIGHVHDDPDEIVIIVLLPTEGAFHNYLHQMAVNPWAQRFMQHIEGEVDWEEIEVNQV